MKILPNTPDHAIQIIKEAKAKSKWVFVAGNGGSSATAEHFTNDLFSSGVKAMCLSSNTSIITMIANDYGYDQIFSKQLTRFANKDDICFLISVSGCSDNILEAFTVAWKKGCKVIAITENGLGVVTPKPECDITDFGRTGKIFNVENDNLMVCHYIAVTVGEK